MSLRLWSKLPEGFLKMGLRTWNTLDYDVRSLIVRLAIEQGFKCALCTKTRKLEVEHDHCPDYGPGHKYTVYNVRGLVCRRCNWHLMVYEKDLHGEYRGFDEVSSWFSDRDWEEYVYPYECRVIELNEIALQEKMGTIKYLRRRIFLDKFDEWREWGPARKSTYPWYWAFDEIKNQKYGDVRTPKQFLRMMKVTVKYLNHLNAELEKNPDLEIPERHLEFLLKLRAFIEPLVVLPEVQARLLQMSGQGSVFK